MLARRATLLAAALTAFTAVAPARAAALLVMNSAEATLSVVDLHSGKEVHRIPVLREPHHWALTPDGRDLLVGDTVGNVLFDFDPETFALRRRIPVADPYQLGFSPDGKWLTVNGLARNQVDVYDAATFKLVHRFPAPRMPSHLAYAPDSGRVFVTLQDTGRLAAFDLHTMQPLWDVPVGKVPAGVIWLDGKLIVALMGEDGIAVIDPADGRIERRISTGRGAHQLFLSPDGKILYVNNRVESTTTALDAATLAKKRDYSVPGGPDDIAFAPDGKMYLTQRFVREVAVLDPVTGAIEEIEVGRSPHGIFLNPSPKAGGIGPQANAE